MALRQARVYASMASRDAEESAEEGDQDPGLRGAGPPYPARNQTKETASSVQFVPEACVLCT
eukprot:2737063-Rhodomonas_salina.1